MTTDRYSVTLLTEAKKLGFTVSDLDRYYNRGMVAWIDHRVPGTTPEQLGMAVVEEFVESEKAKKFTIREDLQDTIIVEDNGFKKVSDIKIKSKDVFGEEFTASLPDDVLIREWATSEKIQSSYIKRYGDKAPIKLSEAANLFTKKQEKQVQTEEFIPPAEPAHRNKPGTKRHSWDMANWHTKKHKEAEASGNKAAAAHHEKKSKEYMDSLSVSTFDRDRGNK